MSDGEGQVSMLQATCCVQKQPSLVIKTRTACTLVDDGFEQ